MTSTQQTTEQAVAHLVETFGEAATGNLVNIVFSKAGGMVAHNAAVRVMAQRNLRGADYASLVQYAQQLPEKAVRS